ncbi:glycosyltransferase family 2 protein [Oculatella sp. LEGE 06141]|uniref:glycosyltransferase n=1 Tax=Oculatella sp. LEGE 06141 TaxID=1828648 RepID=UPI00188042E3|nr:glycosyltransferase family 2 protein [Oculatella sp. LEGE 06141]MBE9182560.1 glycosyltransferase family 2 protein [Oculatella sp. LEGE 06141]
MPENSWRESDSYNELEPISSLTADLSDSVDANSFYYRGLPGRRRKAAVALTIVWSGTIALHLFSWGYWAVFCLTTLMGIHFLRVLLARQIPVPEPLSSDDPDQYPYVSLLVAAKNEESVIASLVKDLSQLDYPPSRYDLWIIDDSSTDRTPLLLDQLASEYGQLNVVHRLPNAGGGKSGALNQVWSIARGDIIAVFDADAQVPKDLLRRVLPMFEQPHVGAVQVRKSIANAPTNALTRCQAAEMAFDSYMQSKRIAIGGLGELRGNGQFVRRAALESCGGWNEETITDDLDLTFRLHLDSWDINLLEFPAVGEEGVTRAVGLWHQRNRWAEGGYQRYLDYWRLIMRNRMGATKTVDLFVFWFIQYIMPTAAVPDCLMAIARNYPPMLSPLTSLSVMLSMIGMFLGLKRIQPRAALRKKRIMASDMTALVQTLRGTFYMFHWLPVIASTTLRISVRPKRLKWVKTIHHGSEEVWVDVPEQS